MEANFGLMLFILIGLFVLVGLGVPIAFAIGILGIIGFVFTMGWGQALAQVQMVAWYYGTDWVLMAIPLYILLGQLVYYSGIADELYTAIYKWLGKLPGGLAIATSFACAGFGAVTGSSPAAVGTMGGITYPIMKRYNYHSRLSTACLAAAGGLAALIPPSLGMVLYGILTETSIGQLFIAGIIPGIVLACIYAIGIYIMCRFRPEYGPPGPSFPLSERLRDTLKVWPILVLFVGIIGGIYAGVMTATEAAGVGCFLALVLFILMRRITFEKFKLSIMESCKLTAMIIALIIGAMIFARFMAVTGVVNEVVGWIGSLDVNRYVIFALIVGVYIILGCVLDVTGMLVITMPVTFPIMVELGFDPVWFGIVIMLLMETALITPPVGANVFVMSNIAKEVPIEEIFKGVFPFFLMQMIMIVILTIFPDLALWLPNTMK